MEQIFSVALNQNLRFIRGITPYHLPIKSSTFSRYYAEACNGIHLRGLVPIDNTVPKKNRSGGEH